MCLFHDQSALNAVCRGRRKVMSPRYNYTTPFALAAGVQVYDPVVMHFTGSDKPWLFEQRPPWRGYGQPYRNMLRDHPALMPYASNWSEKQVARGPDAPVTVSAIGTVSNALRTRQSRFRFDRYMKQSFPF